MEGRTMLQKWHASAPYHIFFNVIPANPDTFEQTNAIKFTDLLCPSFGKLKSSLQLTSAADIYWLVDQYKKKNVDSTPLTVLYSNLKYGNKKEFIDENFQEVTHHEVDPTIGAQHSKIGIYVYDDDSLRVVVSTANLYEEDWNNYNHGLWISHRCRPINERTKYNGESRTRFKSDLLHYLEAYSLPCLDPWIENIRNVDFNGIRVFLVTSVPGTHQDGELNHLSIVGNLLYKFCLVPGKNGSKEENAWKVIGQSSNIGTLGTSHEQWLIPFLGCLAAHTGHSKKRNPNASFSFVYPTYQNVIEGYSGRNTIMNKYSKDLHEQQNWLQKSMFQWKADRLNRSKAMPHIKTYTRVSPCHTKLAYYLLTSANLSKAAWGRYAHDRQVLTKSFEAGVLFLPKIFNEEFFEIAVTSTNKNEKVFPFMYDLPLTKYSSHDIPSFGDFQQSKK